jgi:hypothetical protein
MAHEIVPLTRDHLLEWYGDQGAGPTVRGIAAILDGKLVAIAGLYFARGQVIVFCALKDEARPYKVTIHKTALALIADAKARHKRIVAICDPSETSSAGWLARLGFRQEEGDLWAWQI